MKVVRLSAYAPAAFTPTKYSCSSFLLGDESTAAGRIKSIKNSDTIGNRILDFRLVAQCV